MKRFILAAMVTVAMYAHVNAQTTNTFPATGNVGIGTTSPDHLFTLLQSYANTSIGFYNTNSNSANRNWLIGSNNLAYGDFAILTSSANGGNPRSAGISRFYIDPSGKIGIGTTSPALQLQVQSPGGGPQISVVSPVTSNAGIDYLTTLGHWTLGVGLGRAADVFNLRNETTATEVLTINNVGNVGIGTTAPMSLFQVDDGCTKASIGSAGDTKALNWGTSYLGFNASRSDTTWFTSGDGNNNGGGVIYSSIFGDMYFAALPRTGGSGQTLNDADVASRIAMRIDHTDGAVYAKQIYVQTTGWPDFVFKKGYSLRPLAEVKTYIEQNQHLPDMPAASTVEKDGINLGVMNKVLVKKVEELTLYLIEKDKEKKEQDIKIDEQQAEINEMKKQIQQLLLKK